VFFVTSSTTKLPAAPLPGWVTALVVVAAAVHRCTAVAPLLVEPDVPLVLVWEVLLPLAEVDDPVLGAVDDDDDVEVDPEVLVVVPEPPLPAQAARPSPVVATRASPATCRRAECPVVPMACLLVFASPLVTNEATAGLAGGPGTDQPAGLASPNRAARHVQGTTCTARGLR
jgi:hypothetical protein